MRSKILPAALAVAAGGTTFAQTVEWTSRVHDIDPDWHHVEVALSVAKTRPEVIVAWMKSQVPTEGAAKVSTVWYNVSLDGNPFDPSLAAAIPGPVDGEFPDDPLTGASSQTGGLWAGAVAHSADFDGFWVSRWDAPTGALIDPKRVVLPSGFDSDKGLLAFGEAFSPDSGERMHLIFTRLSDHTMRGITSSSSPLGDVWPDPTANFQVGPGASGTVGQGAAPVLLPVSATRSTPRLVVAFNPAFTTAFARPLVVHTDDGTFWPTATGPTNAPAPGGGTEQIFGTLVAPNPEEPAITYQFPSLASDPGNADRVYLVFSGTAASSAGDDADLFVAMSSDGGASFPTNQVLHLTNSQLGDGADVGSGSGPFTCQLRPWVCVDPARGVDIVYLAVTPPSTGHPHITYQAKFVRITNFLQLDHPTEFQTITHLDLAPAYDLNGVEGFDFDQVGLGHYIMIDSRDCGIYAGFPSRHENTNDPHRTVSVYVSRIQYCGPDPTCYANCDASTTTPLLNVADFACFLQAYAIGDPYANCDGSTTQPELNVQDFTCFLQKFGMGCGQ